MRVARIPFLGVLVLLASSCGAPARRPAGPPPNVLFITIDDLNDWVGCLGGHPQVKTPNIDRLARRGVLFTNAHCQAPICNPSRVSFLTGRLPSSTGMYDNRPNFRTTEILKDAVTLPQHFAAHGYSTLGVGKIFHGPFPETGSFQRYGPHPGQGPLPKKKLNYPTGHRLWDWGAFPDSDEKTHDWKDASWAIERLGELGESPFFLAVGFYRPHVPLYAPQKWFDLYPRNRVTMPPAMEGDRDDLPGSAKALTAGLPAPRHRWFVQNKQWDHAVQSYLATISFVDAQVGRVIDALDSRPDGAGTIIVLLSDHGWHLGEKERWAKRSLWERSTRVPMIIVVPGSGVPGATCSRPVGLIDLYPTLIDLCGLGVRRELEGRSLVPLLEYPDRAWDRPAITTFMRNNHAVRSEHWRYIRYADGAEELYDHREDPFEWKNLADDARNAGVIRDHARWLPKVNAPDLRKMPGR